MWILTMETTGPMASVAIINEKSEIREKVGEKGYNHLTSLIPMTKSLLEESGLTPKDISAVAASVGPGSFTGIRIGVSSARALGQALGIPCLRVPTLQTFLYNENIVPKEQTKLICPILDARRDQLYGAAFCKGRIVVEEGSYSIREYLNKMESLDTKECDGVIFYGDGILRYGEAINLWSNSIGLDVDFADEENMYQRASSGAIIAKFQWELGEYLSYNDLIPEYMRLAEAQQKLKDGTLHV